VPQVIVSYYLPQFTYLTLRQLYNSSVIIATSSAAFHELPNKENDSSYISSNISSSYVGSNNNSSYIGSNNNSYIGSNNNNSYIGSNIRSYISNDSLGASPLPKL
jgi:hypothetical protein